MLCAICGVNEVTSSNPETTFCKWCFYDGSAFAPTYKALTEETGLTVGHTGGGCFALTVDLGDGCYVMATDGDAGLPETEAGPWLVGVYAEDQDERAIREGLDRAALVEYVATLKNVHAIPTTKGE